MNYLHALARTLTGRSTIDDNAVMRPVAPAASGNRLASVLDRVRFRGARLAAGLVAGAIGITVTCAQPPVTTPDAHAMQSQKMLIAQRVATLKATREVFRAAAAAPLPPGMPAAEAKTAQSYVAWLQSWAARLDTLARTGESVSGQDQLLGATKTLPETQMSFNLQYLQLQNAMQNENRQFTMISNIMKTKHDTVKNSISNIR